MSLSTDESVEEIRKINDLLYRFAGREYRYSETESLQFPRLPLYYQIEMVEMCQKPLYVDRSYKLRMVCTKFMDDRALNVQVVAEIHIQIRSGTVQIFSEGRFSVFAIDDSRGGTVRTEYNSRFVEILMHLLIFCCATARRRMQFSVHDKPSMLLCEHLAQYKQFGTLYLQGTMVPYRLDGFMHNERPGSFFIDASADEYALDEDSVAGIKDIARANVYALLHTCAANTRNTFQ